MPEQFHSRLDEPPKQIGEIGGLSFDEQLFVHNSGKYPNDRLRAELGKLEDKDRKKVLLHVKTEVEKMPRSMTEHLAWQRCAMLLSLLDASAYAAIEKKIHENIVALVAIADGLEEGDIHDLAKENVAKADQPLQRRFEAEIQRFDVYYTLAGMQLPERARLFLNLAYSRWERDMHRRLGPEYGRYLRMQSKLAVAGDAAMQKDNASDLRKFIEAFPKEAQLMPRLEQKNGEYFFQSRGEKGVSHRWQIQMYSSSLAAGIIIFRSCDPKKPGLVFMLDQVDAVRAMMRDVGKLDIRSGEAMRQYEAEHGEEQTKALNAYDLPTDRTVAHINMFPSTHDSLIARSIPTSSILSAALAERYKGNFVQRPPLFTEEPKDDLRTAIRDSLAANGGKAMHFCIDVFSHGADDRFGFHGRFDARSVAEIVREFSQCSFTLNTIACHGAGMMSDDWLRKELDADPDLRRRLAIFSQVRPDGPNISFSYTGVATDYYTHFILAIREGKTYGEAHRIADLAVKQNFPMDAQAIIGGQLLVRRGDQAGQPPLA